MAAARSTSSPRNPAVDANPDVARKKQRLSEDDTGPLSPNDSILIEVSEPEDIGTNFANAIEIEDDASADMEPYCDAFFLLGGPGSAFEQLRQLQSDIHQNLLIDPEHFIRFAAAIDRHLADTAHEAAEWKSHYLDEEAEFFTLVATLSLSFLDAADVFDNTENLHSLISKNALEIFVDGLRMLSQRIIPLLPDAIKSTVSRRDSAQAPAKMKSLGALYYVLIASRLLLTDTLLFQYFRTKFRTRAPDVTVQRIRTSFHREDMGAPLAGVICALGAGVREIKDSWTVLHAALELFRFAIDLGRREGAYPVEQAEEVLGTIVENILPTICAKHPRALPDNFHADLVAVLGSVISTYASNNDVASTCSLYKRSLKTEADAMIPQADATEDTAKALWRICGEEQRVLAGLLATSSALQAYMAFIRSEIMDIRNVGITLLKERLVTLYTEKKDTTEGFSHPIIQYAVRFLRDNQITSYIFGPESRAGLVSHSADIICFLAATSTYTDDETDIIWRACSTSVEADFVKASFHVLGSLLRFLDFGNLIYIAQKYCDTPVERLGPDAVVLLNSLFKALRQPYLNIGQGSEELTLVGTAMDILKSASAGPFCASRNEVRRLTMSEISRLTQPGVELEDKMQMYERCIPEIHKHSPHATTSVEILNIFLSTRIQPPEAEHILKMLPVKEAVDEICKYVQDARQDDAAQSHIADIVVRLECIIRLIFLSPTTLEEGTEDRLFSYVFGDSALSNEARNYAWTRLHELTPTKMGLPSATTLWKYYLQNLVPALDAKYAAPKLIDFISASLKAEFTSEHIKSEPVNLLKLPLWKTIVRIANAAEERLVIDMSVALILDLLFACPGTLNIPPTVLIPCQCEFVRHHIQDLCTACEQSLQSDEVVAAQKFSRGINLLGALLSKSKETASTYVEPKDPDILLLDDSESESEPIEFIAQVYGPDLHPKFIHVRANEDTKVSELMAQLPERTAAAENRLIVGGREISLCPSQTLADAQIMQSGVVMIRPKYTYDLTTEKVLTCSGPVEQEIISQYEALESFLDGPDPIAHQAFDFLFHVRTSAQARSKVISSSASALTLFPKDKLWRGIFSLVVLQGHLFDFAKLGVADQGFISRSIRLLASVIEDTSRPLQPIFMFEVAKCLSTFFQNASSPSEPSDGHANDGADEVARLDDFSEHFEDGTQFVSRIIALLFASMELPLDFGQTPNQLSMRTILVRELYKALLELCRTHRNLWKAIAEHPDVVNLHKELLLNNDPILSKEIAFCIESLCIDASISCEVARTYWKIIIRSLSDAMHAGPLSESYFTLLVNLFPLAELNEGQIRSLVDIFTTQLWTYRHKESIRLPLADKAMFGLLRVVGLTITFLKSYKKPLELHGLPARLTRLLLFPATDDPNAHPLLNEETRGLAYNLVRWTFESPTDYEDLVGIAQEVVHQAARGIGYKHQEHAEFWRDPWSAAGLLNLCMTCYMNSLLQQLFCNLQFRKFVLDQQLSKTQQQGVLGQVQVLFARMQNSTAPVITPDQLAQTLGIQTGNQEDVHTFYTTLLSRLEESMTDNDSKRALAKFFTGQSITQIKGDCGHVSSRTESFTELSITVKNKASLVESLDEFVQGEPLEGANKYMCMTCASHDGGRLVNAVRRMCLEEVPDNLTFCLKRFTYESMIEGENKVNDRFEFPRSIDMSLYKRSYLENPDDPRDHDNFELVGVIVHQGSLQFGHYWSYVRVPGSGNVDTATWLSLEDNRTNHCPGGIQEVQNQCFGGPRWSTGMDRVDNAYVLLYQRQSYIMEAERLDIVPRDLRHQYHILPEVKLQDDMRDEINTDNMWRQFEEAQFASGFHEFTVWLLGQLPVFLKQRAASPDVEEPEEVNMLDSTQVSATEKQLSDFIAQYAIRILLADPHAENRVTPFMTALTCVLEANPRMADDILSSFASNDGFGFASLVQHEHAKVRGQFIKGIEQCLAIIRDRDAETYATTYRSLIKSHAAVVGPLLDESAGKWSEYLGFATRYARLGLEETRIILDYGYLPWALDMIYMRVDIATRNRHNDLYTWTKTNDLVVGPVFEFVYDILKDHVDFFDDPRQLPGDGEPRFQGEDGWYLRASECNQLIKMRTYNDGRVIWLPLLAASRHCAAVQDWRDFSPGKLLGLLVQEKVHRDIVLGIQNAMLVYYDVEEENLTAILSITLHYCLNRPDDEDSITMIEALTKNIVMWTDCEQEVLWFYEQAFDLNPIAVVHSMPLWTNQFLGRKNSVRLRTVQFLRERFYASPPLTGNDAFETIRIHITRSLCSKLQHMVLTAYNAEKSRTLFERMIEALQLANKFLTSLLTAVAQARQNGVRLAPEVVVESDESRAALTGLREALDVLSTWDPETTLPTRPHDMRRAVEVESEDAAAEDSDGELDDGSSEIEGA